MSGESAMEATHARMPPIASAWLAGPPRLRGSESLITRLVDDILVLLQPYDINSIYSSEPRTYRLSQRGRAALSAAIASGRVDSVVMASPGRPDPPRDATVRVSWGDFGRPNWPLSLDIKIRPEAPDAVGQVATDLAAFVRRWFASLQAVATFVSLYGAVENGIVGDSGTRTGYEMTHDLPALLTLPLLRRFARGAFWGTGLGPDLCAWLGGRERVRQEAPAAIRQPLGDGVWLQLSDYPPASEAALARMEGYLGPILPRSAADVAQEQPVPAPEHVTLGIAAPAGWMPGEPLEFAVPVRFASHEEDLGAINVYAGAALTPEGRAAIVAAVDDWYAAGFAGQFGGAGLHWMQGPTVDPAAGTLRWSVDLGSANPIWALQALAQRLSALPGVAIRELVLGTEEVT